MQQTGSLIWSQPPWRDEQRSAYVLGLVKNQEQGAGTLSHDGRRTRLQGWSGQKCEGQEVIRGRGLQPPSSVAGKRASDGSESQQTSLLSALPGSRQAASLGRGALSDLAFPPRCAPFRLALQCFRRGVTHAPAASFTPVVWQLVAVNDNKMPFQKMKECDQTCQTS